MKKYILTLALALAFVGTAQLKAMEQEYDDFVRKTVNRWVSYHQPSKTDVTHAIRQFDAVFASELYQAHYRGSPTVNLSLDEYAEVVMPFTVIKAKEFQNKFKELYADELK